MEIVKYICEFFFCNFLHFVELILLIAACGSYRTVSFIKKNDEK